MEGGARDKRVLLLTSLFGFQTWSALWGATDQCPEKPVLAVLVLSEARVMGAPLLRHRAGHTSCHPLCHMLLWTALLFVGESWAPGGTEEEEQRQACFPDSAVSPGLGLSLGKRAGSVQRIQENLEGHSRSGRPSSALLANSEIGRVGGFCVSC